MIAEVVLNSISKATDNIYHYEIPTDIENDVSVGMRVTVKFGNGNKLMEAYVVGITDKSEFSNLKQISEVIDYDVYFDDKSVELAKFMKHRYFCSYTQAFKAMLPAGINSKYTRVIFLEENTDDVIMSAIQNSVLETAIVDELKKCSPLTFEEIASYVGRNNILHALSSLEKNGIIRIENKRSEKLKDTYATFVSLDIDTTDAFELCDIISAKAPAQARALETLCDSEQWLLGELMECADVSKAAVDSLVSKGYASYSKEIIRKELFESESVSEYIKHELTEEQRNA